MADSTNIPVAREPLAATREDLGDRVVPDTLARYRDALAGNAPPKLGPAITEARREQLLDNAIALDRIFGEIAVAAMLSRAKLREACPEITRR